MAAADHYVERPVANLSVRLPDDLLSRFDSWAGAQGGRAPALRRLMVEAVREAPTSVRRLPLRPHKLTVRLAADDARDLEWEASKIGLTPNAWAAAVLRRRLGGKPTFPRDQALAMIATQAELRRIGVNVNQIARALNVAFMEGRVLELELGALTGLGQEIRGHILGLRAGFEGNLAYWRGKPWATFRLRRASKTSGGRWLLQRRGGPGASWHLQPSRRQRMSGRAWREWSAVRRK